MNCISRNVANAALPPCSTSESARKFHLLSNEQIEGLGYLSESANDSKIENLGCTVLFILSQRST